MTKVRREKETARKRKTYTSVTDRIGLCKFIANDFMIEVQRKTRRTRL